MSSRRRKTVNRPRKKNSWSLSVLLANLHKDIESKLTTARQSFAHPGTKGDASQGVWLKLFEDYLPRRYQAKSAHVVDSDGKFSDQIDVVVYDRQYTPLIFDFQGHTILPAESVYAVFEAKQSINAELIGYAQSKAASVRRLKRTSLAIPTAAGIVAAKIPSEILAGVLALSSDWNPPMASPLLRALRAKAPDAVLQIGCVAQHGHFALQDGGSHEIIEGSKAATAFLFELIARLQSVATVPMIDVLAYAKWLAK